MAEWIVSASVLIAIVILLRAVLKGKISLRLQYALWALVLVRLLVPVSFGDTAMSVGNLTQKAAASEPAQFVSTLSEMELPRMTYQAAYNEVAKEYAESGISIEDMPLETYAETVDYEIINKMSGDLSVAEVVKIGWLCGIALVGIWFVISNLRLLHRLKKNRTLLTDDYALPVYLSDAMDTPCLFGLFRPAIYLTGEAVESEDTKRHAIEHELTHFRHKDHIWAILRGVCLAIHWYNPLVWCAAVLSRNDAELACDESTILRLGESERAAYGRTLIRLTCEKRPVLLRTATTMTDSGKRIKERIALLVKKPNMALYTVIAVAVIAAVAVGCTFTGAEDQPASFGEWTGTLTAEAIQWAETAKGYGIEKVSHTVPESERDALSTLLTAITDEHCFRRKPEAEDNGYRLALYRDDKLWLFKCLADGTIGLMFHDGETGAYYGSEGDLLIIESPDLWNYIVETVDEKGTFSNEYACHGLEIQIPREYIHEVIVYSGEDLESENTLISVYGKAVVEAFEAAGLGENDGMGWIFSIVRYDRAEYEDYRNQDHSGRSVFAKDDVWYYCCCTPTDERFYPTGNASDQQRWDVLNSALVSEVMTDFIERNQLEPVNGEANASMEPAAAIYTLFDAAGDMTVTLHLANEGACSAYTVTDRWYAERFAVLTKDYTWTRIEMPQTAPSEYWITAESSDGIHKMTFWSGDAGMIQYDNGSTGTYWLATPLHEGLGSIAYGIRREYDNLDADHSRIRFYLSGSAEEAASAFVHTAFGSHLMSLMPGNMYSITDYEVVDWEIRDIRADDTAVVGWFQYAFIPEDPQSSGIWAGNTTHGTGEYAGMLTAYREFVLQKQDDGYWHCTGLGTGGYTLPETDK